MSNKYQGSCHCGAVRFSFESEIIKKGIRCNCSICIRKGAVMSTQIIAPEMFIIDTEEGALGLYDFGSKTAKHYFCKHCGIYTFHQTLRKPGHFRINLGCLEGIDTISMETDFFDGKNLI